MGYLSTCPEAPTDAPLFNWDGARRWLNEYMGDVRSTCPEAFFGGTLSGWFGDAAGWIAATALGEWEHKASTSQTLWAIGAAACNPWGLVVLSARDIAAAAYRIWANVRGARDDFVEWVCLLFNLPGLIPLAGAVTSGLRAGFREAATNPAGFGTMLVDIAGHLNLKPGQIVSWIVEPAISFAQKYGAKPGSYLLEKVFKLISALTGNAEAFQSLGLSQANIFSILSQKLVEAVPLLKKAVESIPPVKDSVKAAGREVVARYGWSASPDDMWQHVPGLCASPQPQAPAPLAPHRGEFMVAQAPRDFWQRRDPAGPGWQLA
jgi:hypothetical protein